MKHDYTVLDSAIIDAIKEGGKTQFHAVSTYPAVFDLAQGHANDQARAAGALEQPDPWRVVDRRLQALRKRGLLTYNRQAGWKLTK